MRFIGNVEKDAQVRAVASGALPSGDTVIVNADGTVSVAGTTAASVGSPEVFESAQSNWISTAFDSTNNKVVVSYNDSGNSGYGTAVVGTVSGTSISFGTPVVFYSGTTNYLDSTFDSSSGKIILGYSQGSNSNQGVGQVGLVNGSSISFGSAVNYGSFTDAINSQNAVAYDSNSDKAVFAYRMGGSGNRGDAVVGTISGTSISMGSPATFNSGATHALSATFDSSSNKVVICYGDIGSSVYGTAVVATVSGTSISFGSEVVFKSSSTQYTSASFDSLNNKVVVAYVNAGSSDAGEAVVGTVSGTSISFGSSTQFNTASSYVRSVFDASINKVVIAYRDDGSTYGEVISGEVSGTSISFGSSFTFESASVFFVYPAFDSSSNKVVIAYSDGGNSIYGTAAVFSPASTNLTSENFLGFAAHTYADTQSALVNSTCTVDRNQSGLTAGQTYYVQTDGSLGTTAADPSVVAGTAISSTEIIVKG